MDGTGHANPTYIRVKPDKKWSWGIEEPVFVQKVGLMSKEKRVEEEAKKKTNFIKGSVNLLFDDNDDEF